MLTFTLINSNSGGSESIKNEDCFFQVSFSVMSMNHEKCFRPYRTASLKTDKSDEKSNQLLYRKKKTFAVGHGCSPWWDDTDNPQEVELLKTESIPCYEIKPIVPSELKDVELRMFDLSDLSGSEITTNLKRLNSGI